MILSVCGGSDTLEILRLVKIVVKIITISVPILLMVSSMILFAKGILSADPNNSLKLFIKKIIAAILIFLIPTMVNIIATISGDDSTFKTCLNLATREGINQAKMNEVNELIEYANTTLNESDYLVALNEANKIKDEEIKETELNKLKTTKKYIDINKQINVLMKTGTMADYKELESLVDSLPDTSSKKLIQERMEELKEVIRKRSVADVKTAMALISPNYPPKDYNDNITVNYYSSFTFWLYMPDNPTADLPIVAYIHGLGERGDDYHRGSTLAISSGPIFEITMNRKKWDAIIVHFQVPDDQYAQGYSNIYVELLNKLAEQFNANKNKISIMGFSNGCYGVNRIVEGHQDYFSAAVPIGCTLGTSPNSFKTTPLWTLVGAGDGAGTMESFVVRVNAIGGKAKHNYASYKSHNIMNPTRDYSVLMEFDVVEWMIEQERK